jgi:hypothetical protein
VIHLRFLELFLTPGDDVIVYDPSDGSVMARYDGSENMLVSLTSKGDSVRVVFTSADNETTVGRRFKLAHQALSSGNSSVFIVLLIVKIIAWNLTLPYLTLPYLTLPYLTLPYLTLPYLTLPYLTLPYLTLPYLTSCIFNLRHHFQITAVTRILYTSIQ